MPQQAIDLLVSARWIIPIIPENRLYNDCAIAISDGKIIGLHPAIEADRRYRPRQHLQLDNHVLMPGLINAHGRLATSLLRGYADDQPHDQWLDPSLSPAEAHWLSEEFVRDGAELAMAEMLLSGTTCFSDLYHFPEQVAQAARQHGLRCQLAFPITSFASAWARDSDECINKGLALRDEYKSDELISVIFGLHSPATVTDRDLERIATYASELDAGIQVLLHHSQKDVDDAIAATGERPLARLHRLGGLTPSTQCVHMTAANNADLALLAASGAHVVHCPKSNLKRASGLFPQQRLSQAGINIALGTDGAASNNSLDLFSELNTASLLAKGVSGNSAALSAHDSLRMATISGARALGIDTKTGSLELGKAADLIAIDLAGIGCEPLYNPTAQLVYNAAGHRVSHVWVNGVAKVTERKLVTFNDQELTAKARHWRQRISDQ